MCIVFFTEVCEQVSVFNISEVVWLPHWVSKLNFAWSHWGCFLRTCWLIPFPLSFLLLSYFFPFLFVFWSLHASFVGPSSHWRRKQKIVVMPVSNSVLEWSVPLTPSLTNSCSNTVTLQHKEGTIVTKKHQTLIWYSACWCACASWLLGNYSFRGEDKISQPDSEAPPFITELLQLLWSRHFGISFGVDT